MLWRYTVTDRYTTQRNNHVQQPRARPAVNSEADARPAKNNTMPPRAKRAAPEPAAAETETAKKYKSAMDAMADDWICPITTELPLDPVMAEDGHVYERSAIEEFIRVQGARLKSPMTNLPMGPKILASTQARSTIEKLVRSGAIGGDKAERWLERLSKEELVKETKRKALGGCAGSMRNLDIWYKFGEHGLAKDMVEACKWAKMGADLDHPSCLAAYACHLRIGNACVQNEALAIGLTFQAGALGSAMAASDIGDWYYEGKHSLPKDISRAKHWYRKVATASAKDLAVRFIEQAAERVRGPD